MDTLHQLLSESLLLPPEYRQGFSSHLPMALHALAGLGAGDARLREFHARYAERFEGARAPAAAEALADWRDARGDIDAFTALAASFAALIERHGADAALRGALPDLWPGAAGAAFHGLIRTAHAAQAGHAGELAAALAYWAARWHAVPAAPRGEVLGFDEWSRRLEEAAQRVRFAGGSISTRVSAATASPEYAALADGLVIDDLRPLADWAAATYAGSGNFTVLHLVTATRAARVLMQRTERRAEVLCGFVRAFTAGALASNLQPAGPAAVLRSWDEVRAAAIACDDDHVVKVVHALIEEREAYGDGQRLAAANRAVA